MGTLPLKNRLFTHIVVLPRWFAAPVAVLGVILGGLLAGAQPFHLFLAVLSGLGVMAWAHAMNTLLDYSWTKLDRGVETERSLPKPYTTGQQPLATGLMRPREVFFNALISLVLSAIPMVVLVRLGFMWVLLPWAIMALCTFWYSWAKLKWHPELPLALGFGPMAVVLGAAAGLEFDFWQAFLAGIPFGILFGFAAEAMDQFYDADVNWDKGLRNIGAYAWKKRKPISLVVSVFVALTVLAHVSLVFAGVLARGTTFALIPIPLFAAFSKDLGSQSEQEQKKALYAGLALIFSYALLVVLGQGVSYAISQ